MDLGVILYYYEMFGHGTHQAHVVEAVAARVAAHGGQTAGGVVQAAVADVALRRALHLVVDAHRPHAQRVQDCAVLQNKHFIRSIRSARDVDMKHGAIPETLNIRSSR